MKEWIYKAETIPNRSRQRRINDENVLQNVNKTKVHFSMDTRLLRSLATLKVLLRNKIKYFIYAKNLMALAIVFGKKDHQLSVISIFYMSQFLVFFKENLTYKFV